MNSKAIPPLKPLVACLALALCPSPKAAEPFKPASMAYIKIVMSIIGPLWYRAVDRNPDSLMPGTARFGFRITREGRVENLRLVSNTSNEFLAGASARAILAAKLPPIPKTVLNETGQKWIDLDIPFKIFPR